jgi:hypothetical protein
VNLLLKDARRIQEYTVFKDVMHCLESIEIHLARNSNFILFFTENLIDFKRKSIENVKFVLFYKKIIIKYY